MGFADAFFVLADTATNVQRFVDTFIWVYILLIFAYILTSWIRMPYSLHRVQRFLDDVCEPYIRLFRRVLPSVGPSTCHRSLLSSCSISFAAWRTS